MVQIYLSPDLAEMVRQVQAGAGWSNAELVLSAIQATYQQLEGVIAAESAIPTGGLFSREYRPRRGTGSATVQVGIRLDHNDRRSTFLHSRRFGHSAPVRPDLRLMRRRS